LKFPSYVHLVSIIEERIENEKNNFGKVSLVDLKESGGVDFVITVESTINFLF